MLTICDRAKLPRPLCNHPVHGYRADFLWPEHKLIVETDGYATHATRQAFNHDRRSDIELQIAGWLTVRFTHHQVMYDPHTTTAYLRALLRPTRPLAPRSRRPAAALPR